VLWEREALELDARASWGVSGAPAAADAYTGSRQASPGSFCCTTLTFGETGGKPRHSMLGWASTLNASAEDRSAGNCKSKANSTTPA